MAGRSWSGQPVNQRGETSLFVQNIPSKDAYYRSPFLAGDIFEVVSPP